MRLSTIILMTVIMQVSAHSFAQKITLSETNVPLSRVLSEIRSQSGYDFLFTKSVLKDARMVSITVKNEELGEVLRKIFDKQPLAYTIEDKSVVIKGKVPSFLNWLESAFATMDVRGRVVDEKGQPLVGATVRIKGTNRVTRTGESGVFTLTGVLENAVLEISYLGYKVSEWKVMKDMGIVTLEVLTAELEQVDVVSTGYQTLPKERATGSFVQIDNTLLNRRISTNLLDRLEGIASGLSFNRNTGSSLTNPSTLSVRGRSTIYANPNPLIVVDNFPFNGDLSAINPNDIASVTILKDAAAASIWGALSGNGVIVVTTKRGRVNTAPQVEVTANLTIGEQPDIYYAPRLSSASYVGIEQFLFDKGYFNARITSTARPVLSPVVELLVQRRSGQISAADSAAMIGKYARTDTRDDLSRYFYRSSANQQYNINVSGGGTNQKYYFSTGFDRNLTNVERNNFSRISVNGSNTFYFMQKKLEWTTALNYARNLIENNGNTSSFNYPYLNLKNEDGSNASVPSLYRKSYIDTLGKGRLLDWNFRPLDDLAQNDNTTRRLEYRINTQVKYQIIDGLDVSLQYQYNEGNSLLRLYNAPEKFYTRDYINRFTQISSSGVYTRPVPLGGILANTNNLLMASNLRGQLSLNKQFGKLHAVNAIIGAEAREVNENMTSNRLYGYTEAGGAVGINYQSSFTLIPTNITGMIEAGISQLNKSNRFVSRFANASYTYAGKYILSGSARKDESNVFGAATNQKGIPLWSLGASWELSKEHFYQLAWLPYLRLRLTTGYQGNVDNTLSPQVTVSTSQTLLTVAGSPFSTLVSPPNPALRWEKINMKNIGLDFRLSGDRVQGTIEYFTKHGRDLIGMSVVDPTTGVATFKGNTANMKVRGLDLTLNSLNLSGNFSWSSILLFSLAKDRVTKYLLNPSSVSSAITTGMSPIQGNPLYSVYALKWAGLSDTGNPQVMLNGEVSTNYSGILNAADLSNIKYMGPANPPVFGSIRNDFSFRKWSLSVNVTYKFGHYFRESGLGYGNIFGGSTAYSEAQFSARWKTSGDEAITDVPGIVYPANSNRDNVYNFSDLLIQKGDHIRLQDINLGYDLMRGENSRLPFKSLRLYTYINNIGILWKANQVGLDPDYFFAAYPNPRTYAIGVRAGF